MYRGVIPLANTPACIVKLSNKRNPVCRMASIARARNVLFV